jgi:hypothetical protein
MSADMARKTDSKTKLTDAERHKRFVEMARKVEASEDPKDFDKAFKAVVAPRFGDTQLRSRQSNKSGRAK